MCGFLRPVDILYGSADAETSHFDFELAAKESDYVLGMHARNDSELVAQAVNIGGVMVLSQVAPFNRASLIRREGRSVSGGVSHAQNSRQYWLFGH